MIEEQRMIRTLLAEQVKVTAYIQSMVRRPEMADDIFQDVCVLAMEKRAQIRDDDHLRNWLRTTSRLQALGAMRKRDLEHLLLDEKTWDALEGSWRTQDDTDSSLYAESLRRCMALLSESHRVLLSKRFVDGYDYQRLSAEYHRTTKSLYVTFSRMYSFLGKCIADRMPPSHGVGHG